MSLQQQSQVTNSPDENVVLSQEKIEVVHRVLSIREGEGDGDLRSNRASGSRTPSKDAEDVGDNGRAKSTKHVLWQPLALMALFLVFGIASAVSHHGFYSNMNGRETKGGGEQQWLLRAGSILAVISEGLLKSSAAVSFTQCLFRALTKLKNGRELPLKTLEKAYNADTSFLWIASWEMLRKLPLVCLIAAVCWVLPFLSVITAATLSIGPGLHNATRSANMSFLDLSTVAGSVNQPKLFAVYVNGTSNNTMFMDARTIVKQIVFQTASGQRIPQIPQQVQNISYSFSFYGPKINCLDADPTEARIILEFAQQSTNFSDRVVLDYFSFIPDLTQVGVNNSNRSNVIYNSDVGGSRLPDAAVASNELWIMTSKYVNGSSCEDPHSIEKQFSVCKMHEALYSIDISFTNDIQSIVDTGTKVLDAVPYPAQGVLPQGSNLTQFSYAAIMRAIDSLLLGSFSTYNPTADKAAINSSIDTNVDLTALLGSPSLSVFFDRRKSRDQCTPMGQRKNDIERSRNLTLAELIPELSYNISMAMISDSGLAPNKMTEANTSESINIYTYHGRNLWVSYGIAIGLTVLVDLLGLLACLKDKTTYERSLAFILTAAGRGDVAELFSDHLRGTPNMHTLIGGNRIVFHHDEELGLVMGRAT